MKSTPNAAHSAKSKHVSPNVTRKQRPNLRRIDSEDEEDEEALSESFPDDKNVDEEFSDKADGIDDIHPQPRKASLDVQGSQSSASREVKDIKHFFQRGNKKTQERTVCIPCQYVLQPLDHSFPSLNMFSFSEQDLENPMNDRHTFSASTSTTILCLHLNKHHHDAYVAFCEANNIPNPFMAKPGFADQPDTRPRPQYTPAQLLKSIVNFIIADDQVSTGSS